MDSLKAMFTVYFSPPFWIGVYERTENGKTQAAKIVFGAEPKDYEVYERLLREFTKLRFSPQIDADGKETRKNANPKRMQREISKSLCALSMSTKSQQALQSLLEEQKTQRKQSRWQRTEEENERRFLLRQQKKKQKRKGR